MKFLNITAVLGLMTLPIIGCSKKANESVEQKNKDNKNKTYDFKIRNLEKVQFWISKQTHNITQVNIFKKDNSNLNQKLPELKNLNNLTLIFTKELQNNQSKQDEIKQLITTHGQEIKQSDDLENLLSYKIWVINKEITIKVQGKDLDDFKDDYYKINYQLKAANDFNAKL